MAGLKKAKTEELKKDVAVDVEVPVTDNTEDAVIEETVDTDEIEEVEEDLTVEVPEVEEPTTDVVVETENIRTNKPSGNVKIRMRADHKCCIAMERYDLKAGKTYTVPENVKRILNNAGLLAPL